MFYTRKLSGPFLCFVIICILFALYTFRSGKIPGPVFASIRNDLRSPEFCPMPPLEDPEQFFQYIRTPTGHCPNLKEFGGKKLRRGRDGQKWVCMSSDTSLKADSCVVYSFGVNNEWSFDDSIANYGCQVYAFDPTMGKDNFNRTERIHFYNLGLSDITDTVIIGKKPAKVARLEDIRKFLGHEGTLVDYLKVDIERYELNMMRDLWETSSYILTEHVAQLGIEIHLRSFNTNALTPFWTFMKQLECLGFDLIHNEINIFTITKKVIGNEKVAHCYELVWINRRFFS